MPERIIRCGCGDELVTTDPVNLRASYWCPRCLEREVARLAPSSGGENDGD